ncbi:uncharacterized protein METZ01_LOCUS428436, partial [marine metagenome]
MAAQYNCNGIINWFKGNLDIASDSFTKSLAIQESGLNVADINLTTITFLNLIYKTSGKAINKQNICQCIKE